MESLAPELKHVVFKSKIEFFLAHIQAKKALNSNLGYITKHCPKSQTLIKSLIRVEGF